MSYEYALLEMASDYEYLGFDALWSDFIKKYPDSRFFENYARWRFEEMMKEGLEATE